MRAARAGGRLNVACLALALLGGPLHIAAQEEGPAARAAEPAAPVEAPAAKNPALAKLVAEFTDPLTTLPQLFVRDSYTPSIYGTDAPGNEVNIRAIVPRLPRFAFFPFVQLLRPSLNLETVPTGRGSATRTELGDSALLDLVVSPWPKRSSGLTMALGPVFVFPTATHRTAGQGAWQVGPAFAAIYKGIPGVLLGTLIQNPISFAYTEHNRQPLSTLLVQPILAVYIGRGFYLRSADATWITSWRTGTATLLPVSFGLGRVFLHEDWPPVNLFVSGEWMAYRQFAPVAPQTTVRFGMTLGFPQWRPW
ncbi:MAG: hypothetical protein ACRERC_03370 [Candidatus Binatia bacterium]